MSRFFDNLWNNITDPGGNGVEGVDDYEVDPQLIREMRLTYGGRDSNGNRVWKDAQGHQYNADQLRRRSDGGNDSSGSADSVSDTDWQQYTGSSKHVPSVANPKTVLKTYGFVAKTNLPLDRKSAIKQPDFGEYYQQPKIDNLKVKPAIVRPQYEFSGECLKLLAFAKIATNVYNDPTDGDNATLIDGWKQADYPIIAELKRKNVQFDDIRADFYSQLYQRTDPKTNQTEYAYAIRGTDSFEDLIANGRQILGSADQYNLAFSNTQKIDAFFKALGKKVTFIGHSLGGGMASLAGLLTGRPTVTFNAAGLSIGTKLSKGVVNKTSGNIKAYIVKDELIDFLQKTILLKTEGQIKELQADELYDGANMYLRYQLHRMSSVIKGIINECARGAINSSVRKSLNEVSFIKY